MHFAKDIQVFLKELMAEHERPDLELLERSWRSFSGLYSRVLRSAFSGRRTTDGVCLDGSFILWRGLGEVAAYDLLSAKHLLDEGFFVQSPAILRVAMEFGATMSILTWLGRLSDWTGGRPITLRWRPKNKKLQEIPIDECTYGQLVACLRQLVDDSTADSADHQLRELVQGLFGVHEEFEAALDANKYVHKSREVVTFVGWLFSEFARNRLSGHKNDGTRTGILDLRFELLLTLNRSLWGQAASRYIERVRLRESVVPSAWVVPPLLAEMSLVQSLSPF